MNHEKTDGIEKVLTSMLGSRRAKPRENLFEEIYAKYASPSESMITQLHVRIAVAASIILLCFNSYLIIETFENSSVTRVTDNRYSHDLSLGNFNIYSE